MFDWIYTVFLYLRFIKIIPYVSKMSYRCFMKSIAMADATGCDR